ncbi:mechanosensitive ion channel family protein [Halalkaliarchaeum sp. AArc-GB]|uniref:mechanosensitive ion channel family protein n=1 Tax=Halalkaliarchaeum sp. AArc-GB TaxID=3074078 RepID=UPI0028670AC4|nr:mechanosensitive ion channel family protein [Halalkaliarchaeum sp. AArc-GB]MDR5671679.1 mechanosensitive ion channel family protein [Halalkaliarchaeum sp. AArc-GB]
MSIIQQSFSIDPQQYVPAVISAITTVVLFVVVFAIIYTLGKYFMTRAVETSLRQRNFDESLVGLAVSTTVVIIAVVAVALAATVAGFGVVLSAFAVLAGALALAVGFASQNIIANFVAGVFIVQDKPFVVGDWIEWDGNSGVVREIKLRVTKLDTFDNELVTVPNRDLANAVLFNNVANDQRRVSVDFGIGYDDNVELAREAIVSEGAEIDGVLNEPEPAAPVTDLGDSDVVLSGRIWIDPTESSYGAVRAEFVEAVKERFDAEGIDIPYPNTELSGNIGVGDVGESEGVTGD